MDVAARRRRGVRVRRGARRRRAGRAARASTRASTASTPATGSTRPDDGWIQIAAVKPAHWVALCGALGSPSSPTTRASRRGRPARRTAPSSRRCSRRASLTRTGVTWSRRLDDAGVPNEIPLDTHDGELVLFDADNERARARRGVRAPDHGAHAPVRQAHRLLRDARAHRRARRRSSASTPARSSAGSGTPTPRSTSSAPRASSTGPTTTTPGACDAWNSADRSHSSPAARPASGPQRSGTSAAGRGVVVFDRDASQGRGAGRRAR